MQRGERNCAERQEKPREQAAPFVDLVRYPSPLCYLPSQSLPLRHGGASSSLGVLLPTSPLVAPILVRPVGWPTLKFVPFLSKTYLVLRLFNHRIGVVCERLCHRFQPLCRSHVLLRLHRCVVGFLHSLRERLLGVSVQLSADSFRPVFPLPHWIVRPIVFDCSPSLSGLAPPRSTCC